MAAYWVAHVQVLDAEKYAGYTALAPAAFARHGATFLVRGGEAEVLEGSLPDRHVVIEFPTLDAARACYHSSEYQNAKALRDGHCIAHVVIMQGLPTSA